MARLRLEHSKTLSELADLTATAEVSAAARSLEEAFSVVLAGLEMAAHNPFDEETLKSANGRMAMSPGEGVLEEKSEELVSALQKDPKFSSASFKLVQDFHTCRGTKEFHIAWCIAALIVAIAETLIPLAGGKK